MRSTKRPAAQPPELPGYRFLQHLGSGGFADVFLYEQDLPRRKVAVKVLLRAAIDDGVQDRFVSEANAMAQLSTHPSIVTIYFAGVSPDGRPCLVMEYCPRPSLGVRFRRERIPVPEVLRIGIRLASAVETAHAAGILHRDIKPANVLVTDYGWPALTDFGISGQLDTPGDAAEGLSVAWSAPEMFSTQPRSDVQTDCYSLGATVYALLAGRSPFEIPMGNNATPALISRIERNPVPPTGRDDVPVVLEQLLARSMHKRPEARFRSALEFAQALQGVEMAMGLPTTSIDVMETEVRGHDDEDRTDATRVRGVRDLGDSVSDSTHTRIMEPTEQRPMTRWGVLIGVALVVVTIGVIAGVLLFGEKPDPVVTRPTAGTVDETDAPAAPPEAPTDLACTTVDSELTCTWDQPRGDEPVTAWSWSWTEDPADQSTVVEPSFTVEVPKGRSPCVQVSAIADSGRVSSPARKCAG